MARKQTNASFQAEIAGIKNAYISVDQNNVTLNCNVNVQYKLDRKSGKITFVGEEPDFAAIKAAAATELKAVDTEYVETIPVIAN